MSVDHVDLGIDQEVFEYFRVSLVVSWSINFGAIRASIRAIEQHGLTVVCSVVLSILCIVIWPSPSWPYQFMEDEEELIPNEQDINRGKVISSAWKSLDAVDDTVSTPISNRLVPNAQSIVLSLINRSLQIYNERTTRYVHPSTSRCESESWLLGGKGKSFPWDVDVILIHRFSQAFEGKSTILLHDTSWSHFHYFRITISIRLSSLHSPVSSITNMTVLLFRQTGTQEGEERGVSPPSPTRVETDKAGTMMISHSRSDSMFLHYLFILEFQLIG